MIKHLLPLLLLIPILCGAEDKIDDQVRYISGQDIAMNEAIKHAKNTLDDFLVKSKKPPPNSSDFKLKVMLSDESGVEHLWFTPFKEIDGGYAGVLANDPEVIKSVEFGRVYAFKREQITDWGYTLNGKQIGSFTICVLFKSMDKKVVEQYKKDYGFECKP